MSSAKPVKTQNAFDARWWELNDFRSQAYANDAKLEALAIVNDSILLLNTKLVVKYDPTKAVYADLQFFLEPGTAPFATSIAVQWKRTTESTWRALGSWSVGESFTALQILRARPPYAVRVYFRDGASDKATLFAQGIVTLDQDLYPIQELVNEVGAGASIHVRLAVSSKRFTNPQATELATLKLPALFSVPEHLHEIQGDPVEMGGTFSDSGNPWTAWNELDGLGDLSLGAGLWRSADLEGVGNRVLLTLAGLENGDEPSLPGTPLLLVESGSPTVLVRFRGGGQTSGWFDTAVTASPEGNGAAEDTGGCTVARRVLVVPLAWCNLPEISVDVAIGTAAGWTLRDVWVEPFFGRSEPRISEREIAHTLFKKTVGLADTATNIAVTQETRQGGSIAFAEHVYLNSIPLTPSFSGELEDGKLDSDNVVRYHLNVPLVSVSGSGRATWTDVSGRLVDAIPPFYSSYYKQHFHVELLSDDGETWCDLMSERIGEPVLDAGAGTIRLYDADTLLLVDSSFADLSHTPQIRATFFQFAGVKVNSLIEGDIRLTGPAMLPPWAVDGVQPHVTNAQIVSWTDVDAEYLDSTIPVTWTSARAPFVMTQTVRYRVNGGDVSSTSFAAYDQGVMTRLVFDRTFQVGGTKYARTASRDPTTGVATIFLNDPSANTIVVENIQNTNGLATVDMAQASLSQSYDPIPAMLASIEQVTASDGLDGTADVSLTLALGGDSQHGETVTVTGSPNGLVFGLANLTPPATKVGDGLWTIQSLAPSYTYEVSATITNQYNQIASASGTFVAAATPATTAVLVDGEDLLQASTEGLFRNASSNIVTADSTPIDFLVGPEATVTCSLSETRRLHTQPILSSSTTLRVDVNEASWTGTYDASAGVWSTPFVNDNSGGILPATYVRVESGAALMANLTPAELPVETWQDVSASFVVGAESARTESLRIGRDATDQPPNLASTVAEIVNMDTSLIGGRHVLIGGFDVRVTGMEGYDGAFFVGSENGPILGALEGITPEGTSSVSFYHQVGGSSFDTNTGAWTVHVDAPSVLWGPTATSDEGVPFSVRATLQTPWGVSGMVVAATSPDVFVDNPSFGTFSEFSALKTAPLDASAGGPSGLLEEDAAWLHTPTANSLVIRGDGFETHPDGADLQGFVVRVLDDVSGFGATLTLSVSGSLRGAPTEHVPIPNWVPDAHASDYLQVFVSCSASDVSGALVWSDGNVFADYVQGWEGEDAITSCLVRDSLSTNWERRIALPAEFANVNATKTLDVGFVVHKSFSHSITDVSAAALTLDLPA